jgi:tight adherence protein C
MTPTLLWLAAGGAALLLLALPLAAAAERSERIARRLLSAQRAAGVDRVGVERGASDRLLGLVSALGAVLLRGRLLSARTVAELEQTLLAAGLRGDQALPVFLGAKVAGLLLLPLAAFSGLAGFGAGGQTLLLGTVGAAIAGMLLPDLIARRMRARYLAELERGLPDALDMLVICAEAGLGLEAAVQRVAEEIRPAHRAVGAEFRLTASEMKILADRRLALTNMGERTGVDTLKRLATTLSQTLQYGTPLAQALRTLAAEMRQEQLIRFEARAARLPVLLTLPMIVFILPTLFLIVAGPAVLRALALR